MSAIPFILILSALLPYLPGGLRVEHVLIPALILSPTLNARRIHSETPFIVGGLMLGAFAAAFFSRYSWETGADADPLSQFVRLLLPALAFVVLPTFLPQRENVVVKTAEATVIAGALTATFTIASLFSDIVQDLLKYWVQGDEGGVWLNSQDVGRYTGIFNQPIEAGIFYSICLMGAVHTLRYGNMNRIALLSAVALIIFGGGASLSKNFIVLGAACAIGYAFLCQLVSRSLVVVLSMPVIAVAPIGLEQFNFNYINSLRDLYLDQGVIAAISAGRFGSGTGSVSLLFASLFDNGDWVTGRGLGSHLPLDSGYLEYLYQGGIISLFGFILALTTLSWYAWTNRAYSDGQLLLVLVGYIWLASTGGPTITASRAGIVMLIFVCACLVSIRQRRKLNATLGARGGETYHRGIRN